MARTDPKHRSVVRHKRRPLLFGLWDSLIVAGGLFAFSCATFAIVFRGALHNTEVLTANQLIIVGLAITGAMAVLAGVLFSWVRIRYLRRQAEWESLSARHAAVLDAVPGAVIETDEMAEAVYASDAIDGLTGFPCERFETGKTILEDLMDPAERDRRDAMRAKAFGDGAPYSIRYALTRLDGVQRLVEETGARIDAQAAGALFLNDVTDSVQDHTARHAFESRYRVCVQTLPHALLEFDRNGTILFANPASRTLFADDSGPIGLSIDGLGWHESARARIETDMRRLIGEGHPVLSSVNRLHRSDGTFADVRVDWGVRRDGDGAIEGGLIILTDLSDQARLEHAVSAMALTDTITGALNRRRFVEVAEAEFRRAKRFSSSCALLTMRVDGLASARDGDGTPLADPYMAGFADICRTRLRDVDMLGRTGPDVLAAILPEAGSRTVLSIAGRLRRAACELVVTGADECVRSTVSIGAAKLHHSDEDIRMLLTRSEQSADRAHQLGGNRVLMG